MCVRKVALNLKDIKRNIARQYFVLVVCPTKFNRNWFLILFAVIFGKILDHDGRNSCSLIFLPQQEITLSGSQPGPLQQTTHKLSYL